MSRVPSYETIVIQNFEGHLFIEVDNDVINIEDLRKYRKIYLERARYLYNSECVRRMQLYNIDHLSDSSHSCNVVNAVVRDSLSYSILFF